MCKKENSVPHGSTKTEIVSLDAALRMDGFPALDLWDMVLEILHFFISSTQSTVPPVA